MPQLMKKTGNWFRYILTDKNDQWDGALLIWFYAVGLFLYKATITAPFDFLNFGAGCAGVFGSYKALDWFTERHVKDHKDVNDSTSDI